jgi:ribosomal protein S18 acetylase RimI-like enzyme
MYRIRKLKREDIPECHDIQHTSHFHPGNELWSIEYWYAILNLLKDSWVAIDDNDKIVGYAIGLIRYEEQLDNELAWYWLDVCVRRKVIGCADDIMTFLMENYPLIYAYINVNNRAVELYNKRHGWRTVKTIENFYANGSSAYLIASN